MESLQKVSKAVAGAVATVVVAWLAQRNIIIEGADISTLVETLIAAGIGFVAVYFAPRNKA